MTPWHLRTLHCFSILRPYTSLPIMARGYTASIIGHVIFHGVTTSNDNDRGICVHHSILDFGD